jgi:cytochrome c553
MSMKTLHLSVVAFIALAGATWSQAANIEAGKSKATEVCQACHGLDGNSQVPDYPKLGGQHPDYLAKALRDYKSGARKNAIMAGFAAALTKTDIENLAAYYASQPPVLVVKH